MRKAAALNDPTPSSTSIAPNGLFPVRLVVMAIRENSGGAQAPKPTAVT
ncbi:hypothetical protein AB0I10_41090 [Streptomyces sp. NPDC050636]